MYVEIVCIIILHTPPLGWTVGRGSVWECNWARDSRHLGMIQSSAVFECGVVLDQTFRVSKQINMKS